MSNAQELLRLAKLGRRAEQRSEALGKFAAVLAAIVVIALTRAWALMLLLGVLYADLAPAVRPIGWWTSLALALLLPIIASMFHAAKTKAGTQS